MSEENPLAPAPRQMGRYNLFDTPDGGLHISYTVDGSENVEHIEVPGKFIQMAKMLENGSMGPTQVFKMIKGMAGK